ncbi:MAG: hypothetical protein ACTSUE_16140 [Promethearchaeota archaeon]
MQNESINRISSFSRVLVTAGAAFILGFSQLFPGYIFAGDTFKENSLFILILGIFLPLLMYAFKKWMDYIWIACTTGLGVTFLFFLYISSEALITCYLFIPSVIFGNIARRQLPKERAAQFLALSSWVLAWSVPYSGVGGYHLMSITGYIMFAGAVTSVWKKVVNPESRVVVQEERVPKPNGQQVSQVFFIMLYLFLLSGISALVFRIYTNFSWIDPNPLQIGLPRTIFSRIYAPWDSILLGAAVTLYIACMVKYLKKFENRAKLLGFIQLSASAGSWIMLWEVPQIPSFIFVTCGFATFLGGLIYMHHELAHVLNGTILNKARPNGCWYPITLTYFLGVIGGFILYGVIHRNMWLIDYIAWAYAGIILLGGLFGVLASIVVKRVKTKPPRVKSKPRVKNSAPHSIMARDGIRARYETKSGVVLLFMVSLCVFYTIGTTQAHNTTISDYDILYMWGTPASGYFNASWCNKISHVSLGGVSYDGTTGNVTGITVNGTLASYYSGFGIKIMPTMGLSGENLWHLVNNTDGRLDTYCTTFRAALEASTVDGVSLDFEGLELPAGGSPPTDQDWKNLWKRLSDEIFHPEVGDQYILANYWGLGAGSDKDYVNAYFDYVDIHIQNCYESHWHLGAQGTTTIAAFSSGGMLEIYNHLIDKSDMNRVVLGLPLYGYRWVWGETPAIPFREGEFENYSSTVEKFEPYDVIINYANESLIRWDPFSGGEWFEYTDSRGRRCIAYIEGTEQLIQILNAVDSFNIGGLMFWPGGNPPYPGLFDTL